MKHHSYLGAALVAASLFAITPAAHADRDDGAYAALGFALGTALSAGAPVYAVPRAPVVVVPPPYYYPPPRVYVYPRAYAYRSYGYRDRDHWDRDRRWHRERRWEHRRYRDDD